MDENIDFAIVPINPVRFLDGRLGKFDRLSIEESLNEYQENPCYFQKWQHTDRTTIQVLSNYVFNFSVFSVETGGLVATLAPLEIESAILNQTFKVYEVTIDFSVLSLPSGYYYFKIDYENDLAETVELFSEVFDLQDVHKSTMLVAYRNSENNFSVVFHEDLTFNLRVDGLIANFAPEADDLIYNDQKRNATLLDSIPYRVFTLYVGNEKGVPDWMADKVNRVFSCDSVTIDGEYYQKIEGAKWEINRPDEYPFLGLTIDIMPVENRFLHKFKTQNGNLLDPNEFIIVQKIKNFNDQTGGLVVSGEMKDKSLLEKICLVRTGGTFNLTVGTTPGGDEIGTFQITDLITTQTINYLFTTPQTLYLGGITDLSFLSLIWKDLLEKPKALPGGTPTAPTLPPMLVIYPYINAEQLNIDFNVTTGIGRAGTLYESWFIADGRNGTTNMGGFVPVGFEATEYPDLGATFGADSVTLTEDNIPEHNFKVAADGTATQPNLSSENTLARSRTSGGNSDANLGGVPNEATLGNTNSYGKEIPDAIDVRQKSKTVLWIQKF